MTKFEMKSSNFIGEVIGNQALNWLSKEKASKETFTIEEERFAFPKSFVKNNKGYLDFPHDFDFMTVKFTHGEITENYIVSLNPRMGKQVCFDMIKEYIKVENLDWEVEYGYR